MHGIKKVYLEIYIFYLKHFVTFCVLSKVNSDNHDCFLFFMVLTMQIKFVLMFTVIFLISASKYVSILSFNEIRGFTFSELHTFINKNVYEIQKIFSVILHSITLYFGKPTLNKCL